MTEDTQRRPGPLHYTLVVSLVANVILITAMLGRPSAPQPGTPGADDDPFAGLPLVPDATVHTGQIDLPGFGAFPPDRSASLGAGPERRSGIELPGFGFVALPQTSAPATHLHTASAAPTTTPVAQTPATPAATATPTSATDRTAPGLPEGARIIDAEIRSSIPVALRDNAEGIPHAPLAAEVGRLLEGRMDLRRDLRAGDRFRVIATPADGPTPIVHALLYTSERHSRTFDAYRLVLPGSESPSWWTSEGLPVAAGANAAPLPAAARPALDQLVAAVQRTRS
jgi:hypothetical protein